MTEYSSPNGGTPFASNGERMAMKRRASREASARSRKKTKDIIYQLSDENAVLREENASLRAELARYQAENTRLKLMQEEEKLRVLERGRKLNSIMKQLQDQQQTSHLGFDRSPSIGFDRTPSIGFDRTPSIGYTRTPSRAPSIAPTSMPHSLHPSVPAEAPFSSRRPSQGGLALHPRAAPPQVGREMPNDSRDFLNNQLKIQELREKTKGVRDFLARHSI
jgi:hypothetical protein